MGTVVELAEYFISTEGEVKSYKMNDTDVSFQTTVMGIVKNGINSYCVVTNRWNKTTKNFESYNFSHISKIVKRSDGKIHIINHTNPYGKFRNMREELSSELMNSNEYHWYFKDLLERYVIQQFLPNAFCYIKEGFYKEILLQSFVKKIVKEFPFTLHSANKKRLNRFIKQNINRWIMPMKDVRAMEKHQNEEWEKENFYDMVKDLKREYYNFGNIRKGEAEELSSMPDQDSHALDGDEGEFEHPKALTSMLYDYSLDIPNPVYPLENPLPSIETPDGRSSGVSLGQLLRDRARTIEMEKIIPTEKLEHVPQDTYRASESE